MFKTIEIASFYYQRFRPIVVTNRTVRERHGAQIVDATASVFANRKKSHTPP